MIDVLPTGKEVERWVKDVVKHSNHMEYYFNQLGIGEKDPERPHDLVGVFNKLEWDVVRGMALTYRKEGKDFFDKYILPSIELHRNQYHHRKWNEYNPKASNDDLLVGAVDAACSLLEKRVYSGGKEQKKLGKKHDWDSVEEMLYEKNPYHKVGPAKMIVPKMKEIERPKLKLIKNVFDFPNIGVRDDIYLKMKDRIEEGVDNLRKYVDIF